MNPGGPLLRRSLQPSVQARSLCREHRQLFVWIVRGLLSTGKHGSSRPTQETVTAPLVSVS